MNFESTPTFFYSGYMPCPSQTSIFNCPDCIKLIFQTLKVLLILKRKPLAWPMIQTWVSSSTHWHSTNWATQTNSYAKLEYSPSFHSPCTSGPALVPSRWWRTPSWYYFKVGVFMLAHIREVNNENLTTSIFQIQRKNQIQISIRNLSIRGVFKK